MEEDSKPPKREGHPEYTRGTLSEADLKQDPFEQFAVWLEAAAVSPTDESTTMTLATSTLDGVPSARVVLIDEYGPEGFTFYTNYESRKGQELAANSRAAAVFFWPHLERQVRIEGDIEKLSAEAFSGQSTLIANYPQRRPHALDTNRKERIELPSVCRI